LIEFESDVWLPPLGGCDLVLRVQWLVTLGLIKWDFKQLKMKFSYLGRTHVLRGINVGKVQLMAQGQLPKALKAAGHMCMLQLPPK